VKVELSNTTSHDNRPGERETRLLLEVLRDRQADVLRFAPDLRAPTTSNQAERDLRPGKIQQKISGLDQRRPHPRPLEDRGYLFTVAMHDRNVIDGLCEAILGHPWIPPDPTPA
jgi:transposase